MEGDTGWRGIEQQLLLVDCTPVSHTAQWWRRQRQPPAEQSTGLAGRMQGQPRRLMPTGRTIQRRSLGSWWQSR